MIIFLKALMHEGFFFCANESRFLVMISKANITIYKKINNFQTKIIVIEEIVFQKPYKNTSPFY